MHRGAKEIDAFPPCWGGEVLGRGIQLVGEAELAVEQRRAGAAPFGLFESAFPPQARLKPQHSPPHAQAPTPSLNVVWYKQVEAGFRGFSGYW